MDRRRMFHIFKVARDLGPYDEMPTLPEDFELQLHLSRNDRPQPFYLVCDHDTVLAQMSGAGQVEFKESSVNTFSLEPGDLVYVPAGTPHRLIPDEESVQVRYKAHQHELEGVAWYCPSCGSLVWREDWAIADALPQEGYWRACQAFNASLERRLCGTCGAVHPTVDLTGFRWREVGEELRADESARLVPSGTGP